MQNSDYQLASVIRHKQWHKNNDLQAGFVFWAHSQLGLSWQCKLYTAVVLNFFHVKKAIVYLHSDGFKRIELYSQNKLELLRRKNLQNLSLAKLATQVPRIEVVDLRPVEEQRLRPLNWMNKDIFDDLPYQDLHQTLINEHKSKQNTNTRNRRLWKKLISDPILFFKDSKTTTGIVIYRMICFAHKGVAI